MAFCGVFLPALGWSCRTVLHTSVPAYRGYSTEIPIFSPMILGPVFSRESKTQKKGDFPEKKTYYFWFLRPQNGGGVLLTRVCPKIRKIVKFGLFWGIFACSWLVLQNSVPACRGFLTEIALFLIFSCLKIRIGGFPPAERSLKRSKTLECGLFWSIFVSSGVVLQNSAAHQRTCIV